MKFGIGQSVKRKEDVRFLTGRGNFITDQTVLHPMAHLCHASIIYSPHAHAEIKSIDTAEALQSPGVIAVLTGEDVKADGLGGIQPRFMPEDMGGPKGYRTSRPILAIDRVRHVGDRVVMVIAQTQAQAVDAAELVVVDYAELPAVVALETARDDSAPQIYEEAANNTSFTLRMGDKAAADAAFAKAHHVTSMSLAHPRVSAQPIEARASIGVYDVDTGSFTLHAGTQAPHVNRSELARMVFGIPETQIRVIAPDVGGGFGMKTATFPEDALVMWAAKRLDRPVSWRATRSDSFISDDQARESRVEAELALDETGKVLAVRCEAIYALGSYIVGSGIIPPTHFARLVPSVYDIDTVDFTTHCVFTNTPPTTPYRGAGRPEGIYAIERLLDQAAKEMGLDRAQIRRRNFIPPSAMPYSTQTGFVYDSGEFEAILDKTLTLADWPGFEARRAESLSRGLHRGIGICYYLDDSGNLNERMDIRFDGSGGVTVLSGTMSTGSAHETVYAQMVSDWLGVPFDKIRVLQGDTDRITLGRGTYASRSMVVGGSALRRAADAIIDKGKLIAAHLMESAADDIEFKDGNFSIAGTDRVMNIAEIAMAASRPMMVPAELGVGLAETGGFAVTSPSFPNGCHICEIEIDAETGKADIVRYAIVDDFGTVINPMVVLGQVHGGVVQGIGEAMFEEVVYDRESGQLLSGSFMDYCMPRADDMPNFEVEFHNVPCKSNPIGVKGAGEGGTVGATPTIISAILDALGPLGVDDITMPATPVRIWQAITDAGKS